MASSGLKRMAWLLNLLLAAVLVVGLAQTTTAQDADTAAPTAIGRAGLPVDQVPAELQTNFADMVHFWNMARPEVAAQYANAVLGASPSPTVLLTMVEGKIDDKDVGINLLDMMAASETPELSDAAKKLLALTLQGVDIKKKDGERVVAQLRRLGKNQRAYELALRELKYSGEYVVPYALGLLADEGSTELYDEIMSALVAIDRPVVWPLVLGLQTQDEAVRLMIIDVLTKVGYKIAVPALKALVEDESVSEPVKTAASAAIVRIAGPDALALSARQLYFDLAESLYYDKITVVADAKRATTDTWGWTSSGLNYSPAPTQAVNEIMAGQAAMGGMRAAKQRPELVALWLSIRAQLKVELLGTNARNPWDPENMPTTEFFLFSAGQQYLFDVLDRALADDRIAVARQAIQALEDVANQGYLNATALSGGSPLINALSYDDRMVRFEAAFAIVSVEPKASFTRSENVVPVLAEAVNLETGPGVLVVDGDQNNLNRLKGEFRQAGWNVGDAGNGNEGISKARSMARIDGILLASNVENVSYVDVVQLLRSNFATAMVPIIILSGDAEPVMFSHLKKNQKYIAQAPAGATFAELIQKLQALQQEAGSVALDPAVSQAISVRAAQALEFVATADLAFKAAPARSALMAAAAGKNEDLAVAAMKALVQMPDQEIQQHLAAVALAEGASERIQIAALNAVAQIARHIGNQLQTASVTAMRSRIGTLAEKDNAVKDAIGRALGALDLDPGDASQFILKYATE